MAFYHRLIIIFFCGPYDIAVICLYLLFALNLQESENEDINFRLKNFDPEKAISCSKSIRETPQ